MREAPGLILRLQPDHRHTLFLSGIWFEERVFAIKTSLKTVDLGDFSQILSESDVI